MSDTTYLSETLMRGLACGAITPGLCSVLAFDATPKTLKAASVALAQMLEVVTAKEVETVRLGTSETDDDLWGHLVLGGDQHSETSDDEATAVTRVISHPGLLMRGQRRDGPLLVLIPDLTRLSLAAMRACVVLIGADVAHLERFGQQEQWWPQIYWLAGCRRDQVGQISPHLLDRFALRLHGMSAVEVDRAQAVLNWLSNPDHAEVPPLHLPDATKATLAQAARQWPAVLPNVIRRIHDYDTGSVSENTRRQIALARLAQAFARLESSREVQVSHVDQAAQLIGLKSKEKLGIARSPADRAALEADLDRSSVKPLQEQSVAREKLTELVLAETPVYGSPKEPEVLGSASLLIPYPEDTAVIEREATPLRLLLPRYGVTSRARGAVIGVEPTTELQDLAVVGTLLAAAPYQAIRRQNRGITGHAFLLSPSDLRRCRRLPVAELMLGLVLDYTSFKGVDWQAALLPYLRWAYAERASISIVQVGMALPQAAATGELHPNELRAQRLLAPNLLAPCIEVALSTAPGRATPLAHGLELAYQTLRHALQHGRHAIWQALLVILTDGRGNIPIAASQTGRIKLPVGRQGIEDALAVAQKIRRLNGVKVRFLDPQPQLYTQLSLTLADALGAIVEPVPRLVGKVGEDGE